MEIDDQSIIRQCQDGDVDAFELIVKKYQIRIINLCFKYTKNHADAEDVAQEAFIKAFNGLSNFRFESKFYSWLHRIAINCSLNHINSKEKTKERETISENSGLIDNVPEYNFENIPDNYYNMQNLANETEKAYNNLPEELRQLVKLREIEDLSYEQISKTTELPIGTVRSRLHRAREILISEMKKIIKNG